MRLLRHLALLTSLLPAVLFGALAMPALATTEPPGPRAAAQLDIALQDGLLTVNVEGTPLDQVLLAIAEQADIRLHLTGDLSQPVTAWFTLRIGAGIRELIGAHGLVMVYGPAADGGGTTVMTELRAYGLSGGRAVAFTPPPPDDPLDRVYRDIKRGDRKARLSAVQRLHGRVDATAVADLAAVLAAESDPNVRRSAALGLSDSRDAKAVAALKAALGDANSSVRFQAIHGLARIGGPEAARALAQIPRDNSAAIRMQTVMALQQIGDPATLAALSQVLAADADPQVRRVAARTLETLGGGAAWWALHDATDDQDPAVRAAATAALRGNPVAPTGPETKP